MKYEYYIDNDVYYKKNIFTNEIYIWNYEEENWQETIHDLTLAKKINANEIYLFIGEHINALNIKYQGRL